MSPKQLVIEQSYLLTSKKTLIDFEQVVPLLPQGIFSVITRKVPLAVPLIPQWSWVESNILKYIIFVDTVKVKSHLLLLIISTWTSVYSQFPLKLNLLSSKVL